MFKVPSIFIYIHALKHSILQRNYSHTTLSVLLETSGDDKDGVGNGGGLQFFIIFLPSEPSTLPDPPFGVLSDSICSSLEKRCSTRTDGDLSGVDPIDW